MSFATGRYLRFIAWARARGKRPTMLAMSYWKDAGEPEANRDRYTGTTLDRMVHRDMQRNGQLPLFEGEE